jgi:cell division protein FtsA
MSKIAVGIDIGTYQVKVVISQHQDGSQMPKIIGVGFSESKGLRHGYIINQTDAVRSIRKAIRQAEKNARVRVDRAYISIGGIGLASEVSNGSVVISRADNEITEIDIEKSAKDSQDNLPKDFIQNRQIIHSIPIEYKVDSKPILGNDPVGMKGVKLEVKMLYITSLSHHLEELIQTIQNSGIEIADVMAAPLSAGLVTLSKTEKIAGCILANIGSETVSIVVYENDIPISLEVFPIGANDITNDIALGLKVSIEDAEKIKINRDQGHTHSEVPKKKLDDIIESRMSDIFELIDAHLKKIDKSGLLPAGIIITGGGSRMIDTKDLARAKLKLPSKVASIVKMNKNDENPIKVKDATWAVAYGLCVFGLYADPRSPIGIDIGKTLIKKVTRSISNWFKKFLP